MVVVEARDEHNVLIEIAEVSITEHDRIMITDDQGNQVYLSRALWLKIEQAVATLPHTPEKGKR